MARGALTPGNPAVEELREWLTAQRETARGRLENATDLNEILRLQGRLALIGELLLEIDPTHRRFGVRSE